MVNFMNFSNIGINTLKESSAFSKIRNSSKVYNSHLVYTPSTFTNKYHKINSMYVDENSYLNTSSFGARKQHNLSSTSSLGNSFASNVLDGDSLNSFLTTNLGVSKQRNSYQQLSSASPLSLERSSVVSTSEDVSRVAGLLSNGPQSDSVLMKIAGYPTLVENINDNSDKAGLSYPAHKITGTSVTSTKLLNSDSILASAAPFETTSVTTAHTSLNASSPTSNSKIFNISGPNSKVLLGDQSVRNLPDLVPNKSNLNFSEGVNTVSSNVVTGDRSNSPTTPFTNAVDIQTGYTDKPLLNSLSSSRSLMPNSNPAVLTSSKSGANSLDYDSSASQSEKVIYKSGNSVIVDTAVKKTLVSEPFIGSREKTPKSINAAY